MKKIILFLVPFLLFAGNTIGPYDDDGYNDIGPYDADAAAGSPDTGCATFADFAIVDSFADAISLSATVTVYITGASDTGMFVLAYATDTTGSINYDTIRVASGDSPLSYSDTTNTPLLPSTLYYLNLRDTCGNSTGWDSSWTADSVWQADSIWVHKVPCRLDSINPKEITSLNDSIKVFGSLNGGNGDFKIGDSTVVPSQYFNDSAWLPVPAFPSNGTYSIYYDDAYGYSDTLLDSLTYSAVAAPDSFTISDTGGVWIITEGLGKHETGTIIHYIADPPANYHFLEWRGTFSSTSSPDSFTITENHTDSVFYGIDTFYVDTSFNTGCSVVFLSAADSIFEYNDVCSLVVTVKQDSLVNWNGGNDIGSLTGEVSDTLVFNVTSNVSVTATARLWPKYTVDSTIVNGLPDSIVFDVYGVDIDSGTLATVTVGTPADSQWTVSGDYSGITTGFSDTIDGNKSYTFTLDLIPESSSITKPKGWKSTWRKWEWQSW